MLQNKNGNHSLEPLLSGSQSKKQRSDVVDSRNEQLFITHIVKINTDK